MAGYMRTTFPTKLRPNFVPVRRTFSWLFFVPELKAFRLTQSATLHILARGREAEIRSTGGALKFEKTRAYTLHRRTAVNLFLQVA